MNLQVGFGLAFRVQGLGFWVQGLAFRDLAFTCSGVVPLGFGMALGLGGSEAAWNIQKRNYSGESR